MQFHVWLINRGHRQSVRFKIEFVIFVQALYYEIGTMIRSLLRFILSFLMEEIKLYYTARRTCLLVGFRVLKRFSVNICANMNSGARRLCDGSHHIFSWHTY